MGILLGCIEDHSGTGAVVTPWYTLAVGRGSMKIDVEPVQRSLWLAGLHVLVGWWWGSPCCLWAGIDRVLGWGRTLWCGVGGIEKSVSSISWSRS